MNIATRGGVEFLAVFLGLFLSLWFDDYQEDKEVNKRLKEDYQKIHVEIKEDLLHIDTLIASNTQMVTLEEYLLSVLDGYTSFDFDTVISVVGSLSVPTFFGNQSAYTASVASGRFNMSKDNDLVQPISKLYEHYYKRLILNGDLIDQRGEAFDREHALHFFKPIYKSTTVDSQLVKQYFFGDRFHNGLLLYHDFRKKYYLERLRNTRDKLLEVDSVLMKYYLNN